MYVRLGEVRPVSGRMRRAGMSMVTALLAVLLGASVSVGAAASGVSPEIIVPEQYLIGGCAIGFSAYGVPRLEAQRSRPCIGAASVSVSPAGDVNVVLTEASRLPVIRLLVSVSTQLTRRGISAGISAGKDTVAVRLYDDLLGRRLDLRYATDRRRLGALGGQVNVGWTKQAPVGGDGESLVELGIDALGPYRDLATTDAETVQGGCVIRFDRGLPRVHANAAHICTGVQSVGITSLGKLAVNLSAEQRGSVVNAQADPDETLTARGIVMGIGGGGVDAFHYQFYDSKLNRPLNLNVATDRARVAGSYSNVWLTWTKTATRLGAVNASQDPAIDKYGAFMNGSSAAGSTIQTGCTIRFSQVDGKPFLSGTSAALCTGVKSVAVTSSGAISVAASSAASAPVVSTTTVSSRSVTDYGVRAGVSGGIGASVYRLYSLRLGRVLDLNKRDDRLILQRSGSWLSVGWSRQRV